MITTRAWEPVDKKETLHKMRREKKIVRDRKSQGDHHGLGKGSLI